MLALACYVDAAVAPPGYATFIAGDSSLPAVVPFSSTSFIATAANSNSTHWYPTHSFVLYRIDGWGAPYFFVNNFGNITVRPYGTNILAHQEIKLLKIVKKVLDPKSVGKLGLQFPLIVCLPDVLKNWLGFVVKDIVKFGTPFRFGLEAGSKPELLLAKSCLCKGNPEALLVCNGFKDA
ncbi:hypothetical protein CRYUN_Cryun15aG0059000 [Craigia yunnanensis]